MLSFILVCVLVIFSIWIIDKGIKTTLMEIADRKTTEFATRAINSAVKFAEEYAFDDIANTNTYSNGGVSIIGWDNTIVIIINHVDSDRVEYIFTNIIRVTPTSYV